MAESVAHEPPQNITSNAVPVIIEKPVIDRQESLQIQKQFANTVEVDGEQFEMEENDVTPGGKKTIRHLPSQEWELRVDPVSNMTLLYNRVEKKNYWPWRYPQIARSLGLDMPNKPIFENRGPGYNDELEMANMNNDDNNNEMGEGQIYQHVTFGDDDAALDVLMHNNNQYQYQ